MWKIYPQFVGDFSKTIIIIIIIPLALVGYEMIDSQLCTTHFIDYLLSLIQCTLGIIIIIIHVLLLSYSLALFTFNILSLALCLF